MREPDALDSARVLAFAVVAVAADLLAQRFGGLPERAAVAVLQVSFVALPLLYARVVKLPVFAANGYVRLGLRPAALVLVASLGTFWLLNGITHLQTELFRQTGYEEHTQRETEQIRENIVSAQKKGAIPALSLLVLIPPFCEETFFRGILFRGLLRRFGPWVTIGATSILFSYFHQALVQKILMVCLGCYFGAVVYLTGSLWASVIAHGVNNLAVLLLMRIYGDRLPDFVGPWWMYLFSALIFALAMTLLAMERKLRARPA